MNPFHEVLLLIFLFGVTFLLVLPSVCKNLGFSVYFMPSEADKVAIDHENEIRVLKAKQNLLDIASGFPNKNTGAEWRQGFPVDFAIVVVSVRRLSNPHYLLQTAARLMAEVQRDEGKSEIVIFNADENPMLNDDAQFLSRFITVANRSSLAKTDDIFEKEKLDYVGALNAGLRLRSRYVLVVQDDALATSEILWKLRYILKWKMPQFKSDSNNWAFLKLYYPEKWQGFGNPEIPELLLIGILGAFCFATFRRKLFGTTIRRKLSAKIWWLWSGAGMLYFVLAAYSIGRAHWIEMRKVFPLFYGVGNAPGCCIPAVLFPTARGRELVEFLSRTNCQEDYPIDFAFDDFAKSKGLTGLLVSPNLFSHIGFHSSLHSQDKDPREFKLLFEP